MCTCDDWAVGVLQRAKAIVTKYIYFYGQLREQVTFTPVGERLAVELALPDFYDVGLSQPGLKPRSRADKAVQMKKDLKLLCYY